jgi:hypothetical protein
LTADTASMGESGSSPSADAAAVALGTTSGNRGWPVERMAVE